MRNADCRNDPSQCLVSVTTQVRQPLIEWTPIYDGNGRQTNADPNVHVMTYSCAFCGMQWETEQRTAPPEPSAPMEAEEP